MDSMELMTQSIIPVGEVRTCLLRPENKIQEFSRAQRINPENYDADISWLATGFFCKTISLKLDNTHR